MVEFVFIFFNKILPIMAIILSISMAFYFAHYMDAMK